MQTERGYAYLRLYTIALDTVYRSAGMQTE